MQADPLATIVRVINKFSGCVRSMKIIKKAFIDLQEDEKNFISVNVPCFNSDKTFSNKKIRKRIKHYTIDNDKDTDLNWYRDMFKEWRPLFDKITIHYNKANYNRKYVYFPLHYQPEASTIVCAAKYEKQLII